MTMESLQHYTSVENVKAILRNEYGFEPTKITKMDSYCNLNYLATCYLIGQKTENMKVVVKICDENADSFFDNSKLQHAFMLHLSNCGLSCSIPLQTKDRETYVRQYNDKSGFLLQVLSFIPGESVNSAMLTENQFLKICYCSGENLGNLHLIGQNLDFKVPTESANNWCLPHNYVNGLVMISTVNDNKIINDTREHLKSYEHNFLSKLKDLRKGFIHGDFSDTNVILVKKGGEWKFKGVIDFEYCHHGYLIGDLGITIAYFLTKAIAIGCDVRLAIAAVIRGYQSKNVVTEVEKSVLLDCILCRLCLSYLSGCNQASLHPENSKFIFLQSKHVPNVLEQIDKIGKEAIFEYIF